MLIERGGRARAVHHLLRGVSGAICRSLGESIEAEPSRPAAATVRTPDDPGGGREGRRGGSKDKTLVDEKNSVLPVRNRTLDHLSWHFDHLF